MLTKFSRPRSHPQSCPSDILQLLNQGDYDTARQRLMHLPNADHDPDNLLHQAVCLIHLSRPEAALPLCDRALSLAPDNPQAWLFKGVALHRLGHYGEAYDCYHRATGEPRPTVMATFKRAIHNTFTRLRSRLRRTHFPPASRL